MPQHPVILRLPGQADRQVALVEAEGLEHAAAIIARKMPFLPPAYVWIGDRALAGLLGATPGRSAARAAPTAGQRRWQDRLERQRRAERWRQHWIDKADAKRKRA